MPTPDAQGVTIRGVQRDDAHALAAIYNHYVAHTTVTFEEVPIDGDELWRRIEAVTATALPWLVAERDGELLGYAYAGKWKERSGYRTSVEASVYLAPDATGQRLGSALYAALLPILRQRGIHAVIGGIALPNAASVALHEKFGMEQVAHFRETGRKFGQWVDVGYWQLILSVLAAVVSLLVVTPAPLSAQAMDLLITGGTVIDGTGATGRRVDVGIRNDRVVFVGQATARMRATRRIDARGLTVTPGFIDPHTHTYDGLPILDSTSRLNASSLMQGITTVVLGSDGRGPLRVASTLTESERQGLGTNVYALAGFGTVRAHVMRGSSAKPTPVQRDSMRALIVQAMRDGAFGVGSGLFYAPQSYASTDDAIDIISAAKPFGGVYDTHQRDESSYSIGLVNSVREAIRIGCASGLTTNIAHIKALGVDVWGRADSVLAVMREARRRGCAVVADQYPWTASGTALTAALLPRWAEAGGRDSLQLRIADSAQRARILIEMRENLRRRGGDSTILLTSAGQRGSEVFVGRNLRQVAESLHVTAVEAALHIIRDFGDMGVASFNMTESDIETFMRDPYVMTSSDGSDGHPRLFGTYPRKIRHYVLERRVISLVRMVQASSGQVAAVYGLKDRGVIRVGAYADVIAFDPRRVREVATYLEPTKLATGMEWVLVNGRVAVERGRVTGAMAGRALRR